MSFFFYSHVHHFTTSDPVALFRRKKKRAREREKISPRLWRRRSWKELSLNDWLLSSSQIILNLPSSRSCFHTSLLLLNAWTLVLWYHVSRQQLSKKKQQITDFITPMVQCGQERVSCPHSACCWSLRPCGRSAFALPRSGTQMLNYNYTSYYSAVRWDHSAWQSWNTRGGGDLTEYALHYSSQFTHNSNIYPYKHEGFCLSIFKKTQSSILMNFI